MAPLAPLKPPVFFWTTQAPSQRDEIFLNQLKLALDKFSNTCDNFLVTGDYNMTIKRENMIGFLNTFCLEN